MKPTGPHKARLCARFLNGLGWAVFVWSFFPIPYSLVTAVATFLPFAAVLSVRYYAGYLRFEPLSRWDNMAIFSAFVMPLAGLALMALRTSILDWQMFWVPCILASLTLFVTTYTSATEVRTKPTVLIPVLLFCLGYGASATVALNRVVAWAPPEQYQAEVLAKRESEGRYASYYLKLAPWGPRRTPEDVSVPKPVFDQRNEGDVATVIVNKGLFFIRWFQVK